MKRIVELAAAAFVATIPVFLAPCAAHAQAWGEQAPTQFKYVNQGLTNEVYRRQFMQAEAQIAMSNASAAATASAATAAGQSGSSLNNAVNSGNTTYLNITVSGANNTISAFNPTATQSSTGTTQTTENTRTSSTAAGSIGYLNN